MSPTPNQVNAKSWLSESGLEKGDISLFKFDTTSATWDELPTELGDDDDVFYYYDVEQAVSVILQ